MICPSSKHRNMSRRTTRASYLKPIESMVIANVAKNGPRQTAVLSSTHWILAMIRHTFYSIIYGPSGLVNLAFGSLSRVAYY
ncbi:hypothetical protein BJX61DRAFT_492514 [Aspergillus egyptiacus]|nr:hypothetical protein BJX61DRAFT_492514 [Aspergillus egyptiacus]